MDKNGGEDHQWRCEQQQNSCKGNVAKTLETPAPPARLQLESLSLDKPAAGEELGRNPLKLLFSPAEQAADDSASAASFQ